MAAGLPESENWALKFSAAWREFRKSLLINTTPPGTRTPNQLIKSQLLYRLS